MGIETVLGMTYAVFLAGVGWGLETFGRLISRHATRTYPPRFRYRKELDVFECRTGDVRLIRTEEDFETGAIRYRPSPHACDHCQHRDTCGSSKRGPEVVRARSPWLEIEITRFHQGLSVTLLILASLILVVTLAVYARSALELWVLLGALCVMIAYGLRRLSTFLNPH